jgi:hypothetical protein
LTQTFCHASNSDKLNETKRFFRLNKLTIIPQKGLTGAVIQDFAAMEKREDRSIQGRKKECRRMAAQPPPHGSFAKTKPHFITS